MIFDGKNCKCPTSGHEEINGICQCPDSRKLGDGTCCRDNEYALGNKCVFQPSDDRALRVAIEECYQGWSNDGCTYPPINEWDTSKVTDMSYLFQRLGAFNEDIGNWDVSSVTSMRYMFEYADEFDKDLTCWNVNSVVDKSNFAKGDDMKLSTCKQPYFNGVPEGCEPCTCKPRAIYLGNVCVLPLHKANAEDLKKAFKALNQCTDETL